MVEHATVSGEAAVEKLQVLAEVSYSSFSLLHNLLPTVVLLLISPATPTSHRESVHTRPRVRRRATWRDRSESIVP